jgi:NodT family efflux transporter outer membrane factor (OMF) lipoprotein
MIPKMMFPFNRARVACCTVFLLTGCASMTSVKPTAVALQANDLAPGQEIATAGATQWPDATWWRLYGDSQLDRLIDHAVMGSPRIASAASRIAAAQAMARISEAALQPTVEGSASIERTRFSHDYYIPEDINGHYLFDPVWNNSVGASFGYSFDIWGRDRAALEASLDQVKVREYEAQNAKLALEGAVVRTYAELGLAYEIQDHEQAILAAENQTLDLAARRLKAGLGTELEIQQAKNAVSATRAQLEDLSNRMVLLRHQLAALGGDGPGAGDAITRPAMTLGQSIGLPSQIPAELIGRRPDVQAERWRVESASKQIAVAKAAFYPNVNLKASLGLVGIGFGQLVSASAVNSSIGPAITLPIFEGGKLRAGLDVRTSQYDMAVDAYNAAIIEALHQVADGISHLSSLEKLRSRRQETLGFAKRAHELAVIAFRAGLTDYNNVLSTEDALNRAQNLIAEVGYQQITTLAALNEALGGGLIASNDGAIAQAPK